MKVSAAFKIRIAPNETYKTLRRRIAANIRLHLIEGLIKLSRMSEVLLHERFFENCINS